MEKLTVLELAAYWGSSQSHFIREGKLLESLIVNVSIVLYGVPIWGDFIPEVDFRGHFSAVFFWYPEQVERFHLSYIERRAKQIGTEQK